MAAVAFSVWDFADWDTGVPEPRLQSMIDDAMATAARHAPCILSGELSDADAAFAKALIRGAILRWAEAGAGVRKTETFGAHSYTLETQQSRYGMFYDREISDLKDLCGSSASSVRMGWLA